MSKKIICVTGATGNIGSHTLQFLDKSKFTIRVGIHSMQHAKKLQEQGYETCNMDFDKKEMLRTAFKGVDTLLIVPPSSQNRGELCVTAIQVAKEMGVKFVILFSMLGAEEKRTMFQKQFCEPEEALKTSGMKWVILQSTYFQENLLGMKEMVRLPMKNGGLMSASLYDLGRTLANVMCNPEAHMNRMYQLTGPRMETGESIAKVFSTVLGKEVKFQEISPNDYRKYLMSCGMPEWQANGVLEIFEDFCSKKYPVTDHIHKITGQPPRSIEQTAKSVWGIQPK